MTRFQSGNHNASKPKWSTKDVRAFQADLRSLRASINYSIADLARALDYSPKYVRMMQGDFNCTRQPSTTFAQRVAELRATAKPKPRFLPALAFKPDVDAIPVIRILAAVKQCPECIDEMRRGYRDEPDTWWVMRTPRQLYCSRAHRRDAARRRFVSRKKAAHRKPARRPTG
jgi:hypothetical protein